MTLKDQDAELVSCFLDACRQDYFTIMNGNQKVNVDENTTASQILVQGYKVVENANTTNANLGQFGFYKYTPDEQGDYYVYYPYYNRHNDNGKPFKMGPMEFATVRNNIYKLQVTEINQLGLPGDVPPDPKTPDESDDIYMKVTVKVLDWVVRINNVVF